MLYIRLLCTHFVLCMHKRNMCLCQDHELNSLTLTAQCALCHCTKHLACTHMLENKLFPTAAVIQGRHMDAVGRRKFFYGLINTATKS
jgi:hypothetical protein